MFVCALVVGVVIVNSLYACVGHAAIVSILGAIVVDPGKGDGSCGGERYDDRQ